MKIYRLKYPAEFAWATSKTNELNTPIYDARYLGTKKNLITEPLEHKYFSYDGKKLLDRVDKKKSLGNFVNISQSIMFDKDALRTLEHLFADEHEFYLSKNVERDFYYLHFTSWVENSLIYEKCNIKWLNEEEKRAFWIYEYCFDSEKIINKHIFKIKEKFSAVYVSQEFKEVCDENNLTGLIFELVWDSEISS